MRLLIVFMLLVSVGQPLAAQEIKTSGEGLITRAAPGEFLPFAVKLVNFGQQRRADVTINYKIIDERGTEVYYETETVAVETTASFIKQIQLPRTLKPGRYTAVSQLLYQYQEVPATSQFQFIVEKKFLGIFQSDFILWSIITVIMAAIFAVVSRLIIKKQRASRFVLHDYSDKPEDVRIYYEILSDTISQMRLRAGDLALEVAKDIPGLEIDEKTGKVLSIKKDPAKIIALVVLRYETLLGRRVSFRLRKYEEKNKQHLNPVEKNVDVVRKYFE